MQILNIILNAKLKTRSFNHNYKSRVNDVGKNLKNVNFYFSNPRGVIQNYDYIC